MYLHPITALNRFMRTPGIIVAMVVIHRAERYVSQYENESFSPGNATKWTPIDAAGFSTYFLV
jgi:hypothetical protein